MKYKWTFIDKAYIILIGILTIILVTGSIITHHIDYLTGTQKDIQHTGAYGFLLSAILLFCMAWIAVIPSILALVSLVYRHSNVGQNLIKILMILLGPLIVCCFFWFTDPGASVFLEGFEQWVKKEADVNSIQTWLASDGAKHLKAQYWAQEGYPDELPKCLVELNPVSISFSDSNSTNGLTVEIMWMYIMDEYGLIVGSPAMETPEKGRVKWGQNHYEWRRPVKPGAYVFTRG
jgi:hypothetical protein